MIKEILSAKISKVLADKYGLTIKPVILQSEKTEFGDFSTNIAMGLARELKKSPLEIAGELKDDLLKDELFTKVEVKAPGFINFFISDSYYAKRVVEISKDKTYGETKIGANRKVVLEHTNVNPNKALHIGHLRNACLGNSCQRILELLGYKVEAQYYVDDTGVQVAVTFLGMEEFKKENFNHKKYDHFAQDIYVETMEKLEDNESLQSKQTDIIEALDQQKGDIPKKVKQMATEVIYSNLQTTHNFNIDYDLMVWESDILVNGFWEQAYKTLKEHSRDNFILETEGKNAGCWVIKNVGDEDKVVVKSNGVVTYTGKDIAYHLWKFDLLGKDFLYKEWPKKIQDKPLWTTSQDGQESDQFGRADIVVNFIDVRQSLPQLAVKECLFSLGYDKQAGNLNHVDYGIVFLSPSTASELGVDISDQKGQYAMSGRKGIGILADDLLELVENKIEKDFGQTPELRNIAVAAIKYYMLKYNAKSEIVFDLDQALDTQGNTGPYLQYAYARCKSILRKAEDAKIVSDCDTKISFNETELDLIKELDSFPNIVKVAGESYSPHLLCNYLFVLAQKFNSFYAKYRVLGEAPQTVKSRLVLTEAVAKVLSSGLNLLGIKATEKI
ncbi:MAG: arginine--tRNA ligase [Patescibacteria group bacterium]